MCESSQTNLECVVKIHCLGRTCFRSLKRNRDYLKHRHASSWIYLSRLSAKNEFDFLNELYTNGLRVPKPIGWNRSAVVMEYTEGLMLCDLKAEALNDEQAEDLCEKILKAGTQLAESGLIHCDLNEFNVICVEDKVEGWEPVIIDFPQMVSINHPDADYYYRRDMDGVCSFFQKRFALLPEYPALNEIERKAYSYKELKVSGYKGVVDKNYSDIEKLKRADRWCLSKDDETDESEVDGESSDNGKSDNEDFVLDEEEENESSSDEEREHKSAYPGVIKQNIRREKLKEQRKRQAKVARRQLAPRRRNRKQNQSEIRFATVFE
ncbi:hypothetical protein ACOME3_010684 [Neoechinorhynchus agilis]